MKMRINKFISRTMGVSRRSADKLISSVKVNGKQALLGQTVDDETDQITINDQALKLNDNFIYYALYKPIGYVSTTSDKHAEKKVIDLVPKNPRVYPVGRLDKNSEGLILLTNDGEFADKLTHPKYMHSKKYIVTLNSKKDVNQHIKKIIVKSSHGIRLSEGVAKFDEIKPISGTQLQFMITIHQGWKRQIRRMFESLGYEVIKLKRISIGNLDLKDIHLEPKKFIRIEPKDVFK